MPLVFAPFAYHTLLDPSRPSVTPAWVPAAVRVFRHATISFAQVVVLFAGVLGGSGVWAAALVREYQTWRAQRRIDAGKDM